jgi:enoyl-CoA hydratase/carnithine racemase
VATAQRWAVRFVAGPARALRAAKIAVDEGLGRPLAEALELETELFSELFGTRDRVVGMGSFIAEGPGRARFTGS